MSESPNITYLDDSRTSCDEAWEQAYRAFESPEQERAKFRRRLERFGARDWDRDTRIVELFCGSGGGLQALEDLGFRRLEGIDLSANLVEEYRGPAHCYVGDCRSLPFEDASRDLLLVHGGLHHLETLADLDRVLAEVCRVLAPRGQFCAVEPWPTPFLEALHLLARNRLVRRLSRRVDAFQTMVEHEIETYTAWLSRSTEIRALLLRYFEPRLLRVRLGKLVFAGSPRR